MDAKKILKDIEKRAKNEFLPIVGPERGRILEKLVQEYRPKNILEIGTLVGYSALLMSQHLPEGGKITTIEINKDASTEAKENFKKAGASKNIELIAGDAMKIIPKLLGPFDLVFMDAQKDEYYNYMLLTENKLAPKAIIVADNVKTFENEMMDYLDYVRINDRFSSENFDFGDDSIEVTFKL